MTRLDRRALFSSGAAAALLAATGVSLDAAPRTGGRLRLALPRDDSLARLVRGATFDTLTEIAPNGVLKGELATSWRADPQGRIWTIDLREDVRFHDETPLNAIDVADTLQGKLNMPTRIEAVSASRMRIELRDTCPDLPFLLARQEFAIARAETVGTGCYCIERMVADRHYLGRRVSEHYKSGQAGWVDSMEAVVIPDAAVRAEALRDGFVDVAALPRSDLLARLDDLVFHPSTENMTLAVHRRVGMPKSIGAGPMDDGRLAERWWMT